MEEQIIIYHPPTSLYTPVLKRGGERIGEITPIEDEQLRPMTFGELLSAIAQLIKDYMRGRTK